MEFGIKTCEQYVVSELMAAQEELEILRRHVEKLTAERGDGAGDGMRLGGPVETVRATVTGASYLADEDRGIGLTARAARDAIESPDLLRDVGVMCTHFGCSRERVVDIRVRRWPHSIECPSGETFALGGLDKDGYPEIRRVCRDDEEVGLMREYRSSRLGEVEAHAYEVLKRKLAEYAELVEERGAAE